MTKPNKHVFTVAAFIGLRTYLEVTERFVILFGKQIETISKESSYNVVEGLALFTVIADDQINEESINDFTNLLQKQIGAEIYSFRNDDGGAPQSFIFKIIKVDTFRDSVLQTTKEFFNLWFISGATFGYNINYFGQRYIRIAAFGAEAFHPKMAIGFEGLLEEYLPIFSLSV